MEDYIEKVIVNTTVLNILKTSCGDRLGEIIRFELKRYPNEDISAIKTLEWFKHILALVGYTHEHIKDRKFEEQAECWIARLDRNTVVIRHKYWSYKKTKMIFDILKVFCQNTNIEYKEVD